MTGSRSDHLGFWSVHVSGTGYSFQTEKDYEPGSPGWAFESQERDLTSTTFFDAAVTSDFGKSRALACGSRAAVWAQNSAPYCSVFGPDAWSSPFEAKQGDDLAFFDSECRDGGDDYEVYGFLVNPQRVRTPN